MTRQSGSCEVHPVEVRVTLSSINVLTGTELQFGSQESLVVKLGPGSAEANTGTEYAMARTNAAPRTATVLLSKDGLVSRCAVLKPLNKCGFV